MAVAQLSAADTGPSSRSSEGGSSGSKGGVSDRRRHSSGSMVGTRLRSGGGSTCSGTLSPLKRRCRLEGWPVLQAGGLASAAGWWAGRCFSAVCYALALLCVMCLCLAAPVTTLCSALTCLLLTGTPPHPAGPGAWPAPHPDWLRLCRARPAGECPDGSRQPAVRQRAGAPAHAGARTVCAAATQVGRSWCRAGGDRQHKVWCQMGRRLTGTCRGPSSHGGQQAHPSLFAGCAATTFTTPLCSLGPTCERRLRKGGQVRRQ